MESFTTIFARHLARAGNRSPVLPPGACRPGSRPLCTLCHASRIEYFREADARNEALGEFWRQASMEGPLAHLVVSPLGRGYRTVSKRKAFSVRGAIRLGLIDPSPGSLRRPVDVLYCLIEPEAHSVIYRCVQESVTKPYARPLASALRYVIVKGMPPELCVILSVSGIDGKLIRAVNTLSKTITRGSADVTGVWLHQDSTRGTFYLGTANPRAHSTSLKVFGKGELYQKFGGKSFLYPVFSFSQVNASIVDRMIASARELLEIDNTIAFYDLYCGYGVFTLTIGDAARESVGVERSPDSIQAAIANAKRQGAHAVRFQRSDITETSIGASVSRMRPGDCLLLDPPRGGTSPGVIEHLARIRPARVVHIFCDIDGMSTEVKRWRMSGYRVVRGIPFDMFPGTDEAELMVLLEPR